MACSRSESRTRRDEYALSADTRRDVARFPAIPPLWRIPYASWRVTFIGGLGGSAIGHTSKTSLNMVRVRNGEADS